MQLVCFYGFVSWLFSHISSLILLSSHFDLCTRRTEHRNSSSFPLSHQCSLHFNCLFCSLSSLFSFWPPFFVSFPLCSLCQLYLPFFGTILIDLPIKIRERLSGIIVSCLVREPSLLCIRCWNNLEHLLTSEKRRIRRKKGEI